MVQNDFTRKLVVQTAFVDVLFRISKLFSRNLSKFLWSFWRFVWSLWSSVGLPGSSWVSETFGGRSGDPKLFFRRVCTYNHTYSGLIRLMLSASVGSLAMRRPCPCLACDVIPLPYVKTHGPASLPSLSPSVRSLLSLALSFFHLELHCSLHRPLRRQRAADREQAAPPNFTPLDKNQVAWCFMFFPNSGQATLCPISSTGELLRPRPLWINLPRPRWGAYAVSPSLFHHC